MNIKTQVKLNDWVEEDIIRRNAEYSRLAIEEWDRGWSGDFACFIRDYKKRIWAEMASRN